MSGNKNDKDKFILLERGRDFTLTALAEHLNSIYGSKSSGAPFTAIDVQKYVKRGHLPEYIGGNSVEEIRDDNMGIKMVRILDNIHKSCISETKTGKNDNRK